MLPLKILTNITVYIEGRVAEGGEREGRAVATRECRV